MLARETGSSKKMLGVEGKGRCELLTGRNLENVQRKMAVRGVLGRYWEVKLGGLGKSMVFGFATCL